MEATAHETVHGVMVKRTGNQEKKRSVLFLWLIGCAFLWLSGCVAIIEQLRDVPSNVGGRELSKVVETTRSLRDGVAVLNNSSHSNIVTNWCVISQDSVPWQWNTRTKGWIDHFPHAAEILLPCWSWFRSRAKLLGETQSTTQNSNCGFVLMDGIRLDESRPNATWQYQLVKKMRCQVRYYESSTISLESDDQNVFYTPSIRQLRPRFRHSRYIRHPDDAHALQRMVLPDVTLPRIDHTSPEISIGILQRPTSNRRIANLEAIELALQQAFPQANITSTDLNSTRIEDQALWWATHDVIITPHGAAMTNAVFIRDDTIVIQLHPGEFYYTMYDSLVEQCGGISIDWYHNWKSYRNPIADHSVLMKNPTEKNKQHHMTITDVWPSDMVALVQSSLGQRVGKTGTLVYRNQWW